MRAARHGARGAREDDVAAAKTVGVTHQRGDLGGTEALVEVDATRVDHHRHVVNGANGCLEDVAAHGVCRGREALDVVVVDAPHGLDQTSQVPQARPQDDGDGILHRRLASLDDVLGDHADPLLLEPGGKCAVPGGERTGIGPIVDEIHPT